MNSEGTFVVSAPRRREFAALLLLAASVGYLVTFVPRGWVPHDEGMIGQSVEMVLSGAIPHVDYEEPYTGGLTWLYAGLFKMTGTDLVYVRWLLFAGASVALWTTYTILRRHLDPVGAAFASVVALVWSFPNYFAGLPSWWLLIAALICLWALIRHAETGRIRYVVIGGLCAGASILIKQTGVYLVIAFLLSLLHQPGVHRKARSRDAVYRIVRLMASGGALLLAVGLLRSRLGPQELLYLLLPIAACSAMLLFPEKDNECEGPPAPWRASIAIGLACAMLPLLLMTLGYAIHGHVAEFLKGVFLLPQKRLTFASKMMPPATLFMAAGLVVPLVLPLRRPGAGEEPRVVWLTRFAIGTGLALVSLWSILAYQLVWQSARAVAALIPLIAAWMLAARHIANPVRRQTLFASSAMLAWASLVQFPFGAAVYFCYVTPLAVIAAVVAARAWFRNTSRVLAPWGILLFAVAVLSMNRGYIYNLGTSHERVALNAPLNLPRARINVSPEDRRTYRHIVELFEQHGNGGVLLAEPDCPEVYFLTGTFSPRGTFFDFFSDEPSVVPEAEGLGSAVTVVVINHRPSFSLPPSPAKLLELRDEFPHARRVDRFEVRWR